jgi:hypothetical protein
MSYRSAPRARGSPGSKEHIMPLVKVRPPEGVFTKKQMHDVADRITDVTVVFEGSVSP